MKLIQTILCLFITSFSYSQTNIVESSKYGLKNGVVSAKTYNYYPDSQKLNRIMHATYKNGNITSLEEDYIHLDMKHLYTFTYQNDQKELLIDYKHFYKGTKNIDSTTLYQRVDFHGFHFYYPKYKLKQVSYQLSNNLEITYTLDEQEYFTQLIFNKDSTITEQNRFEDFKRQTFNQKGWVTSKKYSNTYRTDYYYNDQGQLITDSFHDKLMNRNRIPAINTNYYYEYDSRGNWVKQVIITPQPYKKKDVLWVRFVSRQLVYKDGLLSGKVDYDEKFVEKTMLKHRSKKRKI